MVCGLDANPPRRTEISEILTMSALERETGAPRSAIHFYIREGLLPRPEKTSASRALYTQDHVRLLNRIAELKRNGRSLAEIKLELATELASANANHVDLAGQERERIHRSILRVATEKFAANGYKDTHIAAIVRESGITSQVFYSHFPTKLQLFVESLRTYLSWAVAFVEPKLAESQDLGERLLWRLLANYQSDRLGSQVLTLLNAETSLSESEKHRLSDQAWEDVIARIKQDLEDARPPGSEPLPVSLDLLCYSLIGAHHSASMRSSWDDRFSKEDPIRLHLWLWLAVVAALNGEVDIDSRIANTKV
jgi:DNA-binding transcriptional MerR regulator